MKLLSLDPLAGWSRNGSILGCSLVLVLFGLHTSEVLPLELQGRRGWELRHGVMLPCPLPCKVTSSSGHMKQLSRRSQGRAFAESPEGHREIGKAEQVPGSEPGRGGLGLPRWSEGCRGFARLLHCSSEPGS